MGFVFTGAKIAISAVAAVIMLDKMGVNVGGILAIGGIGGIALGFAGKDLFANFFGFLVILSERPFKVGDLISSVDGKVKGVVQKVNWRITKILTLEKIPLYIPNSFFTTAVLQNETQMLARRVSEHLKFFCAECSATKVTNFSDSVKKFLQSDHSVDQSFFHVFDITKIGGKFTEFRLVTFVKQKQWHFFMDAKQEILLKILQIAQDFGFKSVYPDSSFNFYYEQDCQKIYPNNDIKSKSI